MENAGIKNVTPDRCLLFLVIFKLKCISFILITHLCFGNKAVNCRKGLVIRAAHRYHVRQQMGENLKCRWVERRDWLWSA